MAPGYNTHMKTTINLIEGFTGRPYTIFPMEFKGRVTEARIQEFVVAFIRSFGVGGANYREGQVLPNISRAIVRNQRTGKTVEWRAPMFLAI